MTEAGHKAVCSAGPAPVAKDGVMYFDTGTNTYRVRVNGEWADVGEVWREAKKLNKILDALCSKLSITRRDAERLAER